MSATKVLLTAEEFDNYPFQEDKRYELDEGELIVTEKPAYNRNHILLSLTVDVGLYLRENPIGKALISENVYALSPTSRRSPDLSIILGDHRAELWDATVIPIIPDIAAEVLSPFEILRMILRKLRHYFAAGVKEVWLLDPDTTTVEVWTGPRLPAQELTEADTLTSAMLPGFSLPLQPLFSLQ